MAECMCVYVGLYVCTCACMCACMCAYVCTSACMCAYMHVWLHICVLCCLCGLSQNIEFHGHAIPEAVGVACRAIPDDNDDVKSLLFCTFAYSSSLAVTGLGGITSE